MSGLTSSSVPLTSSALTEELERAIVSSEWRAGEKLASERQLAERFRVSRPVVREALRRLQERGLIVVQPGRGSYVSDLRPTGGQVSLDLLVRRGSVTVRELVAARRMLEAEAAGLAAAHRTDLDLRRMAQLLASFDASRDVATSAELDVAFHEAVAIASANTVIQIMFGSIRPLTHGMVLRSLTDRRTRNVGAPIHHEILDAITAGDEAAARQAMVRHVRLAEELYGADIDRPLHEVLHRQARSAPEVAALLHEAGDSLRPGAGD